MKLSNFNPIKAIKAENNKESRQEDKASINSHRNISSEKIVTKSSTDVYRLKV
jgi:hypothetical protein